MAQKAIWALILLESDRAESAKGWTSAAGRPPASYRTLSQNVSKTFDIKFTLISDQTKRKKNKTCSSVLVEQLQQRKMKSVKNQDGR